MDSINNVFSHTYEWMNHIDNSLAKWSTDNSDISCIVGKLHEWCYDCLMSFEKTNLVVNIDKW